MRAWVDVSQAGMEQADRPYDWEGGIEAGASDSARDCVASPCVRRCTLDERDLCVGCGRILEEILGWAAAPTQRKIEIRAAAAERLEQRHRRLRG